MGDGGPRGRKRSRCILSLAEAKEGLKTGTLAYMEGVNDFHNGFAQHGRE